MKAIGKKYPYYNIPYIENFKDLLELNYKKTPDKVAFSYRVNQEIVNKTYKDVYDEVIPLSSYFKKKYNNKHIAIVGENSYNWIIIYLAIVLSGNMAVIIDKDYDEAKVSELLKKSDSDVCYYSQKYCLFIKNIDIESYLIEDIEEYKKQGSKSEFKMEIDSDKAATLFFTSGTTGPNKGVVLSQKNICTDIYGAASLYMPDGSTVSFLPFNHSFGLVTGILKPFYYGAPVLINDSLKHILKDIQEYKPHTLFAVPLFVETFYKQINRSIRKKGKEKTFAKGVKISNFLLKLGIDKRSKLFAEIQNEFGGNLKYIICGGAYLDPKYVKYFRNIGIEVLNGYGITECSPVVAVNRNEYKKDGSIGVACRDVEVKVINEEITVKGPNVFKGYYKDSAGTKKVMKNGVFYTGDLGYIDDDGFIHITGRKKNIIILSNGENISPELIEGALSSDDAVSEVVVYEEDDKLVAFIYPSEDFIDNEEYFNDLIYKYNQNKPKNQQISKVRLRKTEFVKNNNKKILRDKIMEE